jgi:hypothetical protein
MSFISGFFSGFFLQPSLLSSIHFGFGIVGSPVPPVALLNYLGAAPFKSYYLNIHSQVSGDWTARF